MFAHVAQLREWVLRRIVILGRGLLDDARVL